MCAKQTMELSTCITECGNSEHPKWCYHARQISGDDALSVCVKQLDKLLYGHHNSQLLGIDL